METTNRTYRRLPVTTSEIGRSMTEAATGSGEELAPMASALDQLVDRCR